MTEQPEMAPDIIITPIATRGRAGERCEVEEKRGLSRAGRIARALVSDRCRT
ncbi:hypothetical protein JCM18920_2013 [Cutibacterium acnes JCM 18920]|nr:hypothetical protein JCM18920_2013 [Cutibacterium acnes JCM 18920]